MIEEQKLKEAKSLVARANAEKRWANASDEEKKEQGRKMREGLVEKIKEELSTGKLE